MHLTETLKQEKIAPFQEYFFDHLSEYKSFWRQDLLLINACKKFKITTLILSSWDPYCVRMPSASTLLYLKSKLKIKIVPIWWDSCGKNFYKLYLDKADPFSFKHVFVDKTHKQNNSKRPFLNLWPPINKKVFFNSKTKRIIDVSFIGSVSAYRCERLKTLRFIKEKLQGKKIFFGGGDNNRMSFAQYARIIRSSKITLNFSKSVEKEDQRKARIFEAMHCGSLVLESKNSQTKKFFRKNKEYCEFFSKEDCLQKIKGLLKNKSKINKIAKCGQRKAESYYNALNFWNKILK